MFPTPHTVQRLPWVAGETDAHGNPTDTYGPAEDVKVYGWAPPAPEERTNERVVIDMTMFAPPGVMSTSRDQWLLPDGLYEQQGPAQDYNHGPFGWQPGIVIRLQRVEG